MTRPLVFLAVLAPFLTGTGIRAQQLKPESMQAYECYVRSVEAGIAERKSPLLAGEARPNDLRRGITTVPGNGANPHKITGAMVYDWIGTAFIPGARVARGVAMLQDYDHRFQYFPELMSTSKLLCRGGEERFGFTMRLKEPSVIDIDSDVVWKKIDDRHWECRSYSTKLNEIGKQHGYLYRLNSYWRLAEVKPGLIVEGRTITLSGEFGSFMRSLGSLAGINPEKSLRKSLASIMETLEKKGLEFQRPPSGRPDCGAAITIPACTSSGTR
jgi:hypothetical protein